MSSVRSLWLGPHLLTDPRGAAAHEAAAAIGRGVHEIMLAAGDRLAVISPVLAQRYYRRAAAAWKAFGPDGFRRWLALGQELATVEPVCRDGAAAFFEVPPAGFGRDALDGAAHWCRLGRRVVAVSPKLASIFFKTTESVLRRSDAMARLQPWVEVGLDLYDQRGWQGEFLAQAYFSSAPRALLVLDPQSYRLWAGTGAALYPSIKEREFFGDLHRSVQRWPAADQVLFLRTAIALASGAPKDAFLFYRDLPPSTAGVEAVARGRFLRILAIAGKRMAGAVADVVPVAGALLQQVPEDQVLSALAHVEAVAERCPEAALAAFRSLPRVYEEATPDHVRSWFATGLAVAAENPRAGLAYFALESRTSLKVLLSASTAASLEECQGLLRKYIQMLSGEPVTIRSVEGIPLRLPLEEFPAEREAALPIRIDLLSTHEDNLRLYRFLAAQVAGRREFGTYGFSPPGGDENPEAPPGSALFRYLTDDSRSALIEELFLLAEGVRIHHQLCASYRGLAGEGRWVASRLLDCWAGESSPRRGQRLDALFALVLLRDAGRDLPEWLTQAGMMLIGDLLAPLARPLATVRDSVRVAEALAAALAAAQPMLGESDRELAGDAYETVAGEMMYDLYADDDSPPPSGPAPWVEAARGGQEEMPGGEEPGIELSQGEEESAGVGQPISAEELKRLLEAGADLHISQAAGSDLEGLGLYITDLLGKVPADELEELRRLLGDPDSGGRRRPKQWLDRAAEGGYFQYDEWDYHIEDYRCRWCHLYEVSLEGDSGEFFNRTLGDYARLIPEVRRQFQRIRPEMYRVVRGLEDGEDFDLNAAIAARVDARAGQAPSSRLYVARKREERDVATLFLLDMSASTDEPLAMLAPADQPRPNGVQGAARLEGRPARRIIDVTKETLVIMAEALEEIGDAYAIYGFSGHGRHNVEVYRVKSFSETLTPTVKARLGGIEPKRSTRMGTALRHAVDKMSAVSARSKHLFLLSDGFPQDYDYGQDRRSNAYGIRDTAVALREAESAGVTPFCITVDKAGHDYLRQMCDESRYLVIEDISSLPRELPKVYQRVVRA